MYRNWGDLTLSPRPESWNNSSGYRVTDGITYCGKAEVMWCEKSDEIIVPMMAIDNITLPREGSLL